MKRLDAQGKGVHQYDYKNDILLFKIQGRNYKQSLEFDDIVIDLDEEEFMTGIRIFDASTFFNLEKQQLNTINNFSLETKAEEGTITINLKFTTKHRNKEVIHQGQNLIRQATTPLADSQTSCNATG